MIKLSFSSLFRLLHIAKHTGNQCEIYEDLFEPICGPVDSNKGSVEKYAKGISLPNEIKEGVFKFNFNKVVTAYESKLVKRISPPKYSYLAAGIKYILNSDTDINDGTPIGPDSHLTKSIILSSNNFNLAILLASVTYYCLGVPNTNESKNVDKEFFSRPEIIKEAKTITFNEDFNRDSNTKLQFTALKDNFTKTFHQLSDAPALPTPNKSLVRLYTLTFQDKNFDLNEIQNLLYENLDCFLFSRKYIDDIEKEHHSKLLIKEAIKLIRKIYGNKGIDNVIDDMLIYLFLECSLKAPKLFSNIEVNDILRYEDLNLQCGIHFLEERSLNRSLVFGVSNINDSIYKAIDSAFDKIINIVKNQSDTLKTINRTALDASFNYETSRYLINRILPNENNDTNANNSFGLCIGYSIEKSDLASLNTADFKNAVEERFKKDALDSITYIHKLINEKGLNDFSFYIYFLPLFNAEKARVTIRKEMDIE